jgi:hypothetical protein
VWVLVWEGEGLVGGGGLPFLKTRNFIPYTVLCAVVPSGNVYIKHTEKREGMTVQHRGRGQGRDKDRYVHR